MSLLDEAERKAVLEVAKDPNYQLIFTASVDKLMNGMRRVNTRNAEMKEELSRLYHRLPLAADFWQTKKWESEIRALEGQIEREKRIGLVTNLLIHGGAVRREVLRLWGNSIAVV